MHASIVLSKVDSSLQTTRFSTLDKTIEARFRLKTKSISSSIRKFLKWLIIFIILSQMPSENYSFKRAAIEILDGISLEFEPD